MQVRCRNRTSGNISLDNSHHVVTLNIFSCHWTLVGVRSSMHGTVNMPHLPLPCDNVGFDFWNVHHSGALLRLNRPW